MRWLTGYLKSQEKPGAKGKIAPDKVRIYQVHYNYNNLFLKSQCKKVKKK